MDAAAANTGNVQNTTSTVAVVTSQNDFQTTGQSYVEAIGEGLKQLAEQAYANLQDAIDEATNNGSDDSEKSKNSESGDSDAGGGGTLDFEVESKTDNSLRGTLTDSDGVAWKVGIDGYSATFTNLETGEQLKSWGDPHLNVNGEHVADFEGNISFDMPDGSKLTIQTTQEDTLGGMTLTQAVEVTNGDYAVRVDNIANGELSVDETTTNGEQVDQNTYDGQVTFEWDAEQEQWVSADTGQTPSEMGVDGLMEATAYDNHEGDVPTSDADASSGGDGSGDESGDGSGDGQSGEDGGGPSDDINVQIAQAEFERIMQMITSTLESLKKMSTQVLDNR